MRRESRLLFTAFWCVAVQIGCNHSDLSGYRQLDKSAGPKSAETTSSTEKEATPDSVSDHPNATDDPMPQPQLITADEPLPVSALVPVNVVDGANVTSLMKVTPKDADSVSTTATTDKPAADSDGSSTVSSKSTEPRKVEILIPEKTFPVDSTSKTLRVSYDDLDLLKVLNMEPVTIDAVDYMPAWLKDLNGKRIKLRGYMYPPFVNEGIERFVLARDNQICCFGRDPKVYDLVQVDMKSGQTTNYIPATRPFDVIGRFRIEMVESDGQLLGLYFLEDAQVIDR